MEDLDFVTAPERKNVYDSDVARAFFQTCGASLTAVKGTTLFTEQTPGDLMYFIVAGEVSISIAGKPLDVIRQGEIIGEMSTISATPRSATAVARTDCILIGLGREQFFATLQQQPEFTLMLMRMMLARLRLGLSMLRVRGGGAGNNAGRAGRVLDPKLLQSIAATLGSNGSSRFAKDRPIMIEGSSGANMYVVLEGRVSITAKGKLLETIGPGGIFGEMALVDDAPRSAAATATDDCALLVVSRAVFIDLVKSNPAFGAELLKSTSERLRFLNAQR